MSKPKSKIERVTSSSKLNQVKSAYTHAFMFYMTDEMYADLKIAALKSQTKLGSTFRGLTAKLIVNLTKKAK